jgi:uncharacterized protein (DUF3084 family)
MKKEAIDKLVVDLQALTANLQKVSGALPQVAELEAKAAAAKAEHERVNKALVADRAKLTEVQSELARLRVQEANLSAQVGELTAAKGDIRAMCNEILSADHARQSTGNTP